MIFFLIQNFKYISLNINKIYIFIIHKFIPIEISEFLYVIIFI